MSSFPQAGISLDNQYDLDLNLRDSVNRHGQLVKEFDLPGDHLAHTTPFDKDVATINHLTGLAGLKRTHRYKVTRMVSWWTAIFLNTTYERVFGLVDSLTARTMREPGFSIDEIPGVAVSWLKSRQDRTVRVSVDGNEVYGAIQDWSETFAVSEQLIWSYGLRKFVLRKYSDDDSMKGIVGLYRRECKILEDSFERRIAEMSKRAPMLPRSGREARDAALASNVRSVLASCGAPMSLGGIAQGLYHRDISGSESRMLRRFLASMTGVKSTGADKNRVYGLLDNGA